MAESLIYYRPDTGAALDLNDLTNYKMQHHEGFGIGDFTNFSAAVPDRHGEYQYGTRIEPKVVTIDLVVFGAGVQALETKRRALIDALNPLLVDTSQDKVGKLRLVQTDGTIYQMDCVLASPMSLPTRQHIGFRAFTTQLKFKSVYDPVLYDPTVTNVSATFTPGLGFQFNFQLPFQVSASGLYSAPAVVYAGQIEAPVLIDITGPAGKVILRNNTTGKSLEFLSDLHPLSVPATKHLIINTDPFKQTILLDGVPHWQPLTLGEFWGLVPGTNNLTFDIESQTVGTSINLSYNKRMLGA